MPLNIALMFGKNLNERAACVRRNSWIQVYKSFWQTALYKDGVLRKTPLTVKQLFEWASVQPHGDTLGGLSGATSFAKWLNAARGVGEPVRFSSSFLTPTQAEKILTAAAIRAINPVVVSMNVLQVCLFFFPFPHMPVLLEP